MFAAHGPEIGDESTRGHWASTGLPPGLGRVTDWVSSVLGLSNLAAISLTKLRSPMASSIEAPVRPRNPRSARPFELPSFAT